MVLDAEQEKVECLLRDAITTLCQSGVTYHIQLAIQAKVVLTVDKHEPFCISVDHVLKQDDQVAQPDGGNTQIDEIVNDESLVGEEATQSEAEDISDVLRSMKTELCVSQNLADKQDNTEQEVEKGPTVAQENCSNTAPPKRKRGRPPKAKKSKRSSVPQVVKIEPDSEEVTPKVEEAIERNSGDFLETDDQKEKWHRGEGDNDEASLTDLTNIEEVKKGLYKCKLCEFTNKKRASVRKHLLIHSHPKLTCQYCDKQFTDKFRRKRHVKEVHVGEKPICKICKKRFATLASLKIHENGMHKNKKYHGKLRQCDKCNYTSSHHGNMLRHIRTSHQQSSRICLFCKKEFTGREALKEHVRTAHPKDKVECPHCSKVYKTFSRLHNHIKNEHGDGAGKPDAFKCSGCSFASTSSEQLQQHVNQSEAFCTFCNNQFSCKNELKDHLNNEHAEEVKRKECEFCGKVFQSKNGLYSHKKIFHSGESNPEKRNTFTCHVCGKGFPLYDYLKRHIRSHDASYQPYECPKCHKRFKYHRNCKTHKEGCLNVAGYQCHLCGKKLKNEYSLREHTLNMHTNDRKDRFPCRKCKMLFSYSGSRSKHEKTCNNLLQTTQLDDTTLAADISGLPLSEPQEQTLLNLEPPQFVVEVGTVIEDEDIPTEIQIISQEQSDAEVFDTGHQQIHVSWF